MPPEILSLEEFILLSKAAKTSEIEKCLKEGASLAGFKKALGDNDRKALTLLFEAIDEDLRKYLPLRDTDKISVAKAAYARRTH